MQEILINSATPIVSIIAIVVTVYLTQSQKKNNRKIAEYAFLSKNTVLKEISKFEVALIAIITKRAMHEYLAQDKQSDISLEISIIKHFQVSESFLFLWAYYSSTDEFSRFCLLYNKLLDTLNGDYASSDNYVISAKDVLESVHEIMHVDKLSCISNDVDMVQLLLKASNLQDPPECIISLIKGIDAHEQATGSDTLKRLLFIQASGVDDPAVELFINAITGEAGNIDEERIFEMYGISFTQITELMIFERYAKLLKLYNTTKD